MHSPEQPIVDRVVKQVALYLGGHVMVAANPTGGHVTFLWRPADVGPVAPPVFHRIRWSELFAPEATAGGLASAISIGLRSAWETSRGGDLKTIP